MLCAAVGVLSSVNPFARITTNASGLFLSAIITGNVVFDFSSGPICPLYDVKPLRVENSSKCAAGESSLSLVSSTNDIISPTRYGFSLFLDFLRRSKGEL